MDSEDLLFTKMLKACGYNDPKSSTEISCAIKDMEKEGYSVSDYTKKIISSFFKMSFNPQKINCSDLIMQSNKQLLVKNRFTIDPTMTFLKEEVDRMEEVGDIIKDYIVPIGIYNGDFLSVGASDKIYSLVPSVKASVVLLGMNFDDFLLRYYHNSDPIFTWIL